MASSGLQANKDAEAASLDFFQESSKTLFETSQLLMRCLALEEEDRELDRKIEENRKEVEYLKEECTRKDQHAELLEKNIASLAHQKQILDEVNSGLRNQISAIDKKIAEDREKYKTTLAKYDAKWESYLEVYNQFPHVREKNLLEKEVKYLRIKLAEQKQRVVDTEKKIALRKQLHAQQYVILEGKRKALLAEQEEWEVERSRRISNIEMKRMQLKALDEEYENMMAKISESDADGAVRLSIWSNGSHLSQISTCGKSFCNKSRSNSDNLLRQPSNPLCGVRNLQAGQSSQFMIPKLNIPSFPETEDNPNMTLKNIQDSSPQHTSLTQPALSCTVRTFLPQGTPFSLGHTSVDDNRRDDPQMFQTTIPANAENVGQEGQNSVVSRSLSSSGIPEENRSHSSLAHEVSPLTAIAPNVTASGISKTISSTPLFKIPSLSKEHSKQTVPTRDSNSRLSQDMFNSQETQKNAGNAECAIQHDNQAGDTPQIIQMDVEEENRVENPKSRECVEDTSVNPQQAHPKFLNAEQDSDMYPYECQTPPNFDLISSPPLPDETADTTLSSPQILINAEEGRGEPTIGSSQKGFNPFGFGYRTSVANIFGGPSEDASINKDAPQTGEAFYMFQKNSASTFKLF